MRHLFVIIAICLVAYFSLPAAPPTPMTDVQAVRCKDGSAIFWQDGFLLNPILKNTGSHLTHAALVLDGYVYEAVPPCVHKVPIKQYLKDMETRKNSSKRDFNYFVIQPKKPYTPSEVLLMYGYAKSQLGRPYMLRGFWKGREVRGIFCSQYVGNAIEKTGRIVSGNFHESPGSLYEKLKEIYQ